MQRLAFKYKEYPTTQIRINIFFDYSMFITNRIYLFTEILTFQTYLKKYGK